MRTTFEPYFAVCITPGPDTLIALSGELDLAAVPVFKVALQKLELPSVRDMVLDLARLTFMDAAGLHAVLDLHAACRNGSTALTIVPGPRNVHRVFELTGCDQLLPFGRT
jgi:anti-anti-sigma factor